MSGDVLRNAIMSYINTGIFWEMLSNQFVLRTFADVQPSRNPLGKNIVVLWYGFFSLLNIFLGLLTFDTFNDSSTLFVVWWFFFCLNNAKTNLKNSDTILCDYKASAFYEV